MAERVPFDLQAHLRLVSEAGEDWISASVSADAIRKHMEKLETALTVVQRWVRLLGPDAGTSAGGIYLNSPVLSVEDATALRAALHATGVTEP